MAETVMVPIVLKHRVIRIEGSGLERKVLLDGVDISRYITGIDVSFIAGSALADVTLHAFGFLEMPDEFEALVKVDVAPRQK